MTLFKSGLTKWIKSVQKSGYPLIITQNGKFAGVLLSPPDFDELVHQKLFIDSVNRGIADVNSDNFSTTDTLKAEIEKRRVYKDSR